MSLRERAVFAPLVFMTLLLGVYPVLALDLIGPSVQSLIDNYNSALSIAGIDGNTMIASH
jgi:NADH-quinone oxidoreductase subunit M